MVARLNWNESFSWAPALRSSRESLEFRSSAPADCCIAGCLQRRRRRLRRGSLTCRLMKTCLCVTFNISHRVFHLWPTRKDVQHTMTSCKSKNCIEARLFTVKKSNSPSHKTNQFTRTWFRMSKLRIQKDLQVKKLRGGTSIRLQHCKIRWQIQCHILNVTH